MVECYGIVQYIRFLADTISIERGKFTVLLYLVIRIITFSIHTLTLHTQATQCIHYNYFVFSVMFQVIEAELHRIEKANPDCLSANTSVEQLALREMQNTRRL